MSKLKSHKTVEQIAKKHRLDVSFIKNQLEMGIPIEHEHTKDKDLATDIALQHLDEIPDYYTRLKKMESSAKKHHKQFKDVKEGNLHKWFSSSKSKDGKPGWVNVVTGGTCASDEPGEGTPKCVSSSKRSSMTKSERLSASRRKKSADPGQQEKSGAAKPTYVSTDKPKKMNEESDIKGKGSGKKDACYRKVKSRYDVWPSAYASGALVKCRKVGASKWGTKSEETMHEEERYCPLCQKRETRSECSYGEKVWDKISVKDEEYSMARSELSNIENSVKRLKNVVGKGEGNLEAWVQSKITKAADYIDTAADYLSSGEATFEEKMLEAVIGRYKEDRGGGKTLRPSSERMKPKKEDKKEPEGPKITKLKPRGPRKGEATASQVQGWRGSDRTNTNRRGQSAPQAKLVNKEEKLVDKILKDIHEEDPCWKGYKQVGMKTKNGKKVPNCVSSSNESITIEDANGNSFVEIVDLIKPEPLKEATRLQAETGNIISVTLSWRGKYYSITMFFPQAKLPSRKEISQEIQKIYPDSKVVNHSVSQIQPGKPLIRVDGKQGGDSGKFGPNKNYVKPMGEEVEIGESVRPTPVDKPLDMAAFKKRRRSLAGKEASAEARKRGHEGKTWADSERTYSPDEAKSRRKNMSDTHRSLSYGTAESPDDNEGYPSVKTKNPKKLRKQKAMGEIKEAKKSEMPCNKPKAQAHGSGETGKSHVVKACSGGKEKLIRFGQLGVKGSPKKKGESKEYASRRHRFQSRHAKNIAKGKMSAAYWANKVKW